MSIVTPAYNAEKTLLETIRSVQSQSFGDWEWWIVDDGSRDGTAAVIHAAATADPRIRYLSNGRNLGAGPARNAGLDAARGQYVAFLDSDDRWAPEKLSRQLAFIAETGAGFSFTSYSVLPEGGARPTGEVRVPGSIDYEGLLRNTIIGCSTVMIERSLLDGLRMAEIPSGQDYTLWFRLLRERTRQAHGLDELLATYVVRKGSVSRNKFKAMRRMWRLYREFEGLSLAKSMHCFVQYGFNAVMKSRVRS